MVLENHNTRQVVKGFLPVDEYGNLVKDAMRAPEITLEGMPNVTRKYTALRA